ncbi:hypothetical protein BgAZ_209270 [Babesia gibsoni]|uniref:Mitochondrial import inner membrane translocase subunit TIM50 n=1 Tax=Babesia gibsoni TaxID=33632 RepID=A0AAD8PEU2_BABGI|nr:hypothetical protein BgAZ_209270 [Babesia gibsoni]
MAQYRYYRCNSAATLCRALESPPWYRSFSTVTQSRSHKRETSGAKKGNEDGKSEAIAEKPSPGDATDSLHRTKDDYRSDYNNFDEELDGEVLRVIPMGIFGCASLVLAGYWLSYLRSKDEEDVGILAMVERSMDQMVEKLLALFPSDDNKLLPDVKDLNYPPNLPTLVVDLDKVVAKLEYDRRIGWQVKKRPYADRFFRELVNYYEIVIWSDDSYPVATDVANRWGLPVIGCIHRDQCKKFRNSYIKDLSKLGRDLRRVVLLDHDRIACLLQEGNAIIVKEFDGDENDTELLHLLGLLKTIAISPHDVTYQLKQLGGGLDTTLPKRFAEKTMLDSERARSRQNLSKRLGFKHY